MDGGISPLTLTVILDFNRKSSGHVDSVSQFFVGESLNMVF
jgi:hypothetical protein